VLGALLVQWIELAEAISITPETMDKWFYRET